MEKLKKITRDYLKSLIGIRINLIFSDWGDWISSVGEIERLTPKYIYFSGVARHIKIKDIRKIQLESDKANWWRL